MGRKELIDVKDWVVVETPSLEPHYYKTFHEALASPIKGHVMTQQYYKYHYLELI